MFESHFGLRENPFVAAHQARYIYPSPEHQEALAHLRYGIENREPFVLITGEVGTGKTTALFDALSEWEGRAIVGLITNSSLTRAELIEEIALRLGMAVPPGASKPHIMVGLEQHLLGIHQQGHRAILLLDEAQNLERELLEEIRLLSNLEADGEKLVQIFLVGQPELEGRLALPDLRQLRQRIAIHYRLRPLGAADAERYIHHRIAVAGGHGLSIFPPDACAEVHRLTNGIPREMNHLCSQAMICAFVESAPAVTPAHVRAAAHELEFQSVLGKERRTRQIPVAVERRQGPTVPGAAPPPERESRGGAARPAQSADAVTKAAVPGAAAPSEPELETGPPVLPSPPAAEASAQSSAAPQTESTEAEELDAEAPDTDAEAEAADAEAGTTADEREALEPEDGLTEPETPEAETPVRALEPDEVEDVAETAPPVLSLEDTGTDEEENEPESEQEIEPEIEPEIEAEEEPTGPETAPPRIETAAGPEPAGQAPADTPPGAPAAGTPPAPAASGADWQSWFKSLAEEVEAEDAAAAAAPPQPAEDSDVFGAYAPEVPEAGDDHAELAEPGMSEPAAASESSAAEADMNEEAPVLEAGQGEPAEAPAASREEVVIEPAASSSAFAEALRRAQAGADTGPGAEATSGAAGTPAGEPHPERRARRSDEETSYETLPPRLREKMEHEQGGAREPGSLPMRLLIAAGLLIVVIVGAVLAKRFLFAPAATTATEETSDASGAAPSTSAPAATTTDPGTRPGQAADAAGDHADQAATPPAGNETSAAAATAPATSTPPPTKAAQAAPPAPSRTYMIAVGTYLNQDRAKKEQTRLTTKTEFAVHVGTVHDDDVSMYRVTMGSFATRTAAERAASDLISKGLVDEARVLAVATPAH